MVWLAVPAPDIEPRPSNSFCLTPDACAMRPNPLGHTDSSLVLVQNSIDDSLKSCRFRDTGYAELSPFQTWPQL
jgi:hypothetical protein